MAPHVRKSRHAVSKEIVPNEAFDMSYLHAPHPCMAYMAAILQHRSQAFIKEGLMKKILFLIEEFCRFLIRGSVYRSGKHYLKALCNNAALLPMAPSEL
jgi:hypothetical protein